jgi:hypothetical protein
VAVSLVRHRAVAFAQEGGTVPARRSSVEQIPSPRTTTPGKKSAPAKKKEGKG